MGIRSYMLLVLQLSFAALAGCRSEPEKSPPAHHEESRPAGNSVDVPDTVRRNLGITFAKVELRPVAQTIRVPGQFEPQPDARREYRTMLAGRVELLVAQFETVEVGRPLYRLASTEWRELQEKLNETESSILQCEARTAAIGPLMAAHLRHEESLRATAELWEKRVHQLDETRSSGVVTLDGYIAAQTTLATARANLAEVLEKEAELEAQRIETQAQLGAAQSRFRLLLATAATVLGIDEAALTRLCDPSPRESTPHRHEGPATQAAPLWREVGVIEVRAAAGGVVDTVELTNGAWAASGSLVATTMEPSKLRFRAHGMQSDLGRLRNGLPVRIVPPKGGSIALQDTMEGVLQMGLRADSQERTLELFAAPRQLADWARPGISAHMEIVTAGGAEELAIPVSSVIQDGLAKVIFRRDPKNPDKIVRLEADLGVSDGRWVVVNSGVREGDEVVLDGVYQLMIATSGSVERGGHFHSDGSFHAGEDK